jgi:hypothetical protein
MLRSSGTATMVETRLLWVERILCWPSLEYDESWWLRGGGGTVGLTMHREPLERNKSLCSSMIMQRYLMYVSR